MHAYASYLWGGNKQFDCFGFGGCQVLDEVHESSVDADLLNFLIKKMMASCPVKIIVMSATLQTDTLGVYFTPPSEEVQPAIFVGVKRFPVRYALSLSLSFSLSLAVSLAVSCNKNCGLLHKRPDV